MTILLVEKRRSGTTTHRIVDLNRITDDQDRYAMIFKSSVESALGIGRTSIVLAGAVIDSVPRIAIVQPPVLVEQQLTVTEK